MRLDDLLHEQSLGELVDVAERVAAQHAGALADEVLELRAAELVVETGLHHADELADAHLAAPQPVLGHHHAGEAGDEGAVEVEERADLGSRRAGLGSRRPNPAAACARLGVGVWPSDVIGRTSVRRCRTSGSAAPVKDAGHGAPVAAEREHLVEAGQQAAGEQVPSVTDGPVVAGGDRE